MVAVRRIPPPVRIGIAGLLVLSGLLPLSARPVSAAVPDPADDLSRVSLSTLQPRTSAAPYDLGRVYRDGCHVARATTSPTHCTYGRRDGTKVVVVIGDSVMAQWWAAIDGRRAAGWLACHLDEQDGVPGCRCTISSGSSRYAACDTGDGTS